MSSKSYKKKLKETQLTLLRLQHELYELKVPIIIVFEGWDAAGKGGSIRRVTERLDPRGFQVHPIAAPDEHELRYHYLHRFWSKLPEKGQMAIFDRSWYGRVLVERVEGFADEDEWQRSYEEINDFEKMLAAQPTIIIKFWLQISKDEQYDRFKARENNPFKSWKLTDEDWRNREKWDQYEEAINEMFEKTNTEFAPWYVIDANNKQQARLSIIEKINDEIKKRTSTFR